MVEKALAGTSTVYSLGPVIHNPQVIKNLKGMGLKVVERLEDIDGGVVIIRSHGAPPHTYSEIEHRGLTPVDTTCPFVKKMHRQARTLVEEGYQLVIVGDSNHSEITSLTDDPHFHGLVVNSASELEGMDMRKRIGLISQTTQPMNNFNEVANRLLSGALELKIFNTICDSTVTRQVEASEIASRVEAMIVIGGCNSANTRRLVEICQHSGHPTHWVETAAEIEPSMIDGIESVGITAGASTPEWLIKEVVSRLESISSGNSYACSTLPYGRHSK